jgi:proline dehydrogenase
MHKVQKGEILSVYERREFENFKSRFETICREAYLHHVKILIDAEESWIQNVIDDIAREMMAKYNKEKPIVFTTLQMYRKDRLAFLKQSAEEAQNNDYILGIKLVRGAYLEKEIEYAADNRLPNPICRTKEATDSAFNQAATFILTHINRIAICCGTHNEKSNYRMIIKMDELNINVNHPHVFFAQLLGMSDHITYNLAKAGYNVAKYVPYGPVEAVMPYLIRRASENSAVAGQTSRELKLIKMEMKNRKLLKESQKNALNKNTNSGTDFQVNGYEFQDI